MKPQELLQALMDERGLNPNSLSAATKNRTKQPQIHRFLKGDVTEPKRSTLLPVAEFFGVPVEAFFDAKVAATVAADLPARRSGGNTAAGAREGSQSSGSPQPRQKAGFYRNERPPPDPPADFSDNQTISDSDFGILMDVKLVFSPEELQELNAKADRLRKIAAEQLENALRTKKDKAK